MLKLKESSGLAKAKSVVDETASGLLLQQSFDVIFKEIERYNKAMLQFQGVDWASYHSTQSVQK